MDVKLLRVVVGSLVVSVDEAVEAEVDSSVDETSVVDSSVVDDG